jgi:capsular exopolysaccharide synthesis family protein
MSLVPTRDEVPQFARYTGVPASRSVSPSKPAATGGGLTGKDIWRLLLRRKWLILLSLLVFTGVAYGVTKLWRELAPVYEASALMGVNPPKATELQGTRDILNKENMERMMLSHIQSIKSEDIFREAIKKIGHTAWLDEARQGRDDVVQALIDEVSVSPISRTNFIQISMSGTNPEDLVDIVNAVAQAAEEDTRVLDQGDRQKEIDRLKQEERRVSQEREDNIQRIQSLLQRGIGGQAVEAQRTLELESGALIEAKTMAQGEYVQALKGLEEIRGKTDEELAQMPEVEQYWRYSPVVQQLESQLIQTKMALEEQTKRLGENHKSTKSLADRVAVLNKQIELKRQELIGQAINQMKMLRESAFFAAEAKFKQLQTRVEENDQKLKTIENLLTSLQHAKEEKQAADKKLAALETRLMDLRLLLQGEQPLVLHRIAPLPKQPSFPKYQIMIPLGVVLGLMFGVGLAFLLEFMDTSIKAPSDVSRRVDLPLLGMIPHLDDVEEEIDDIRLIRPDHNDTIVDESFRQIRRNLTFSGPPEQQRSIMVTSPMPEDGRTTVSMNLAHAIAHSGKRVLVVDANFRQPALRKLYPICPEGGLSTVLVGQGEWQELIHEIEPNLCVMASGPIPPNPTELLGSSEMSQLIESMLDEYDKVIIDCAPLLVVSDAAVLSTLVSGTILVVRAGVNSYGIVQRCRDVLSRLGSHIFGVALNGVRVRAGGYLRKNYETYYEYRERGQLPPPVNQE